METKGNAEQIGKKRKMGKIRRILPKKCKYKVIIGLFLEGFHACCPKKGAITPHHAGTSVRRPAMMSIYKLELAKRR